MNGVDLAPIEQRLAAPIVDPLDPFLSDEGHDTLDAVVVEALGEGPEHDLRAALALADVPAKVQRLLERQPVGRRAARGQQQPHIDAAVGLAADQVRGRAGL